MSKKTSVEMELNSVHSGDKTVSTFAELGKGFIALGKALKNEESDLKTISDLALEVGLILNINMEDRTASAQTMRETLDEKIIALVELQKELNQIRYNMVLFQSLTGLRSAKIARTGNDVSIDVKWFDDAPYSPTRKS